MKRSSWLILLTALVSACSPVAKPIEYGSDMCQYCKMTIVDAQHAAEAVTIKGKVHKFDAIECLARYLADEPDTDHALLLVNDYEAPGELIPAAMAHYLVSEAIPSPMGASLSAFSSPEKAGQLRAAKGGMTFDWEGIQRYLRTSNRNLY